MDLSRDDAGGVPPQTAAPPHSLAWHRAHDPRPDVEYAGFWRRFLANCIDGIVLGIANNILARIIASIWSARFEAETSSPASVFAWAGGLLAFIAVYMVVDWLYYACLESSSWRATLGKRALGIAVTDIAGGRISFGRATGRYFAHVISLLTLGIGYLIQPFTERRQALHDLIAGTVVVRADSIDFAATPVSPASGYAPVPVRPQSARFPRWAVVMMSGLLLLAGGCAALGYFVVVPWYRETQTAVSDEIANTIASQVSGQIEGGAGNRLVLDALDLDINNTLVPGEAGVESGTDGTWIYGFVTGIDPTGITLGLGQEPFYSAVPIASAGRIELTEVTGTNIVFRAFLSADTFANGMKTGINRALEEHGVRATAVILQHGSLTIQTDSVPTMLTPVDIWRD